MLCFRMLSRFSDPARLIDSTSHSTHRLLVSSSFIVFNKLRTLFTSLAAKITRILFPINRLHTLQKTTEGVIHHFPFSRSYSPFARLTRLESVLTQSAPAIPLESALTENSVTALQSAVTMYPGGVPSPSVGFPRFALRKWLPLAPVSLFLLVAAFPLSAQQQPPRPGASGLPATTEGDFTVTTFKFHSGESLPTLRLHYTTLGRDSPE